MTAGSVAVANGVHFPQLYVNRLFKTLVLIAYRLKLYFDGWFWEEEREFVARVHRNLHHLIRSIVLFQGEQLIDAG